MSVPKEGLPKEAAEKTAEEAIK